MKNPTNLVAIAMLALGLISFSSCKEDPIDSPDQGALSIEIEHVWGMNEKPFLFGETMVHPMTGDSLTISTLTYYVSNLILTQMDGTQWKEENSYRLIDPQTNTFDLSGIPKGSYSSMTMTIGVDSLHNCSGLQEGALNPSKGMFWSWNTGYIFIRCEGQSPSSSKGAFTYHLGGYLPPNNAIQTRTLNFGSSFLEISANSKPTLHLKSNVAKLWHGPVKVSDLSAVHMPGSNAVSMSANFADGFRFDHIHP
ncbi:MAG: hypothetical protein RL577_252 [Bacteroidota bacterium]